MDVQVPVTTQETASTPPFTDVHCLCLHDVTSKNEDVFESLTENVYVLTI